MTNQTSGIVIIVSSIPIEGFREVETRTGID